MAVFIIPDNPDFNVTAVEQVKQSDFVVYTHLNGYFQILLNNDRHLFKKVESAVETMNTTLTTQLAAVRAETTTQITNMQEQIEHNAVQECTEAEINTVINGIWT